MIRSRETSRAGMDEGQRGMRGRQEGRASQRVDSAWDSGVGEWRTEQGEKVSRVSRIPEDVRQQQAAK